MIESFLRPVLPRLYIPTAVYNHLMPYVMFVLMCLIWGASFLLMRWAADLFNAQAISAGRMFGGMLVLFVIWGILRRVSKRWRGWAFTRRDIPALGLVVVVGFIVPWTLQPYLIGTYQQSGLFGMMVALVPLLTVAVSVPMLGTRPTARQGLGVLLGLAMITILLGDAVNAHGVPVWAMLLALAVPLCYAISNTWVKLRFHDVDTLLFSATVMGLGLLFILPMARLNANPPNDVQISKAIASVAFLGIAGSGLAMWMFYKMIQLRGPLFAGMVTYVVPGIAVLLGWALEGEVVTRWQMVALFGILCSVTLVQWPSRVAGKPGASGQELA